MERFGKDGKLIVPLYQRKKGTKRTDEMRYAVTEAYCPNGCNIIDEEHKINGLSGLRLKYKRPGMEGELVLSAIQGDFDKVLLSSELEDGVKDELYCPYCGVMFKKLVSYSCKADADMVVIGLTPELDYNNAISFCNMRGCRNGTTIHSGDVLRHLELWGRV